MKINSLGNTIWIRTYGGISEDCGISVVQTSDGGYFITGYTRSFGSGSHDVYLINTDSLGDTVWTRTYGGTESDVGRSGVQTIDGGYVITGWTWSFGAGRDDIYLIKLDSLGNTMWTRTYGDVDYELSYSVAQTSDGGYIITGFKAISSIRHDLYLIRTNSFGDTIWTKLYGDIEDEWGLSVVQTMDGGYIITGYTESYGAGDDDVYLIKTDSLGNVAGIKEAEEREERKQMTVYPNPFTTSTTITLSLPSIGHRAEGMELKVFNVSGRLVKSVPLTTNHLSLGTDLSPGIYFLKVNGKPAGKVVKVR